jgi:hypothetical protein
MRGLDRRLRMRYAEGAGDFRCEGLGAGRREKLGDILGRQGWLRNLRLAVIDYDNLLYLNAYDAQGT